MKFISWNEIPNFLFAGQVQGLVRRSSYEPGLVQRLAHAIYSQYIAGKSFEDGLQMYLNVCWTIDRTKVQILGVKGSTVRSNMLMQAIAMVYAADGRITQAQIDRISTTTAFLKKLGTDSIETWFFPKLQTLQAYADYALRLDDLVAGMVISQSMGEPTQRAIADAARQAGAEVGDVMAELTALRKYGVKSSFFQDGWLHGFNQAWVFLDFIEIAQQLQEWRTFMTTRPLALTCLSTVSDLADIRFEQKDERHGEGKMHGISTIFTASSFMYIDQSGELDLSPGFGLVPVRSFFARQGKEDFYEVLRFAQAMRLYDLVVPLATVAKLPQPQVVSGVRSLVAGILRSKSRLLHPDLIVPRLLALQQPDRLARELAEEIERAEEVTAERARTRRHSVVYHIRQLPQGRRASREARQRAAEYDIVLATDETFVQPHERGLGVASNAPHRARPREQSR